MNAYLSILSARFRVLLQYRAAAIAGLATQVFWGLIRVMIFGAFFHSTTKPQPMSESETITYIWLGQALFALMPYSADADVRKMIQTGTVAYEMLRPLDLYMVWYMRTVAARTAPTMLRAVPIFVLAGLFGGLHAPPSFASLLAWIAGTVGALMVACAIGTLLTISLLYTVSGDGINRIVPPLMYVFSGMILPLLFYPDWLQPILNFLPFRDLVDVPFRLYFGQIPPAQIGFVLAHELTWTLALVGLGRWLLTNATRRMIVQGG